MYVHAFTFIRDFLARCLPRQLILIINSKQFSEIKNSLICIGFRQSKKKVNPKSWNINESRNESYETYAYMIGDRTMIDAFNYVGIPVCSEFRKKRHFCVVYLYTYSIQLYIQYTERRLQNTSMKETFVCSAEYKMYQLWQFAHCTS